MGLIAVDKLNRKVLGYLCRNNDVLAYCCSTCDIEFKQSNDLEAHMDQHELKLTITSDLIEISVNSPVVEATVSHIDEGNYVNDAEIDGKNGNDVEIDGKDANVGNDVEIVGKGANVGNEVEINGKDANAGNDVEIDRKDANAGNEVEINGKDANAGNEVEINDKDVNVDSDGNDKPAEENPNSLDTASVKCDTLNVIDKTTIPDNVTQYSNLKNCFVVLVRCDELAKAMEALQSSKKNTNIDESDQEEEEEEARNARELSPEQYDSDISDLIRPTKFDCNKCTSSYSSDRRLQCHIQRVHPNHVCVMCGEIFKASIHLLSHQRKHQALAKELVFPCNVCGDNVTDVKKHMDMHRARNDIVSASNGLIKKTANGKRPAPKRPQRVAKSARLSAESNKSSKIRGKPLIKLEKSDPTNCKTVDDIDRTSRKPPTSTSIPLKPTKNIKIEGNSSIIAAGTTTILSNFSSRIKHCPICSKTFTKRARLIQHVKIHNEDYVECELCPHKILKKNYMPVHMKKYHNTEESSTTNAQNNSMPVISSTIDTNGSLISTNQSIYSELLSENSTYTEYFHDDNSQITEYDYQHLIDENLHESMHVEQAILSAINTDEIASSEIYQENLISPTTDSMRLAMESSLLCNLEMN